MSNLSTFHRSDEAFAYGIVGRCARSAETLLKSTIDQSALIFRADILTATVGVMNQSGFRSTQNKRHSQCFQRQFGCDVRSDCPSDAPSTKCIEENGQVDPAGSDFEERYVGQPQLIRRGQNDSREIWKISGGMTTAIFRPTWRLILQVVRAHQTQCSLRIDREPALAKTIGDLTVAAVWMLQKHFLNDGHQSRITASHLGLDRPIKSRPCDPERTRKERCRQAHHAVWRRNYRAGEFRGQRESGYAPRSRASSLMRCKAFFKTRFSAASCPSWRSSSPTLALSVYAFPRPANASF